MTGIKIPVQAELDNSGTDQALEKFGSGIDKLGQKVAAANKLKYEPIGKATLDQLKQVQAAFENLRKISGDLNKRINATGQKGTGFADLDWDKLYHDPGSRARQMQKSFQYVVGDRFSPMPGGMPQPGGQTPAAPPPPSTRPPGSNVTPFPGRGVLGAGLNALGPVGQVANGAISAGASGGLGAGLMGFAGGLAALALGKAIGAVKEKIGAAEQESIGYDTLKRTLGDVNVGFNALREGLRASGNALGMNINESQKLGQQFVKLSGITGDQSKTLADEVYNAGGAGRALGLDPSTTTNFFAMMRQFGGTRDTQGSRELAVLIGESVAKSGGTAKSEELLSQIASFSAQQARGGLNGANVPAYMAMLGGMVGSKIPGMDPEGAGAILSRMNSAVAGGGNAGEAGQNFLYSALGQGRLSPLQVKMLQEQGLFGTGAGAFGAGSVYARAGLGKTGLENSNVTNFQLIKERLEKMYGDPLLAANAAGNLYGLNTTQSLAMAKMNPQMLGGVGARLGRLGIDMKNVNSTGILRMGQIEADGSMSEAQKDAAMREAATKGQEDTEGSNIRASKNALENIQQQMAQHLIPMTQAMRDGIIYMAGGGGKMSTRQIQEAVLKGDSRDRIDGIETRYTDQIAMARKRRDAATNEIFRTGRLGLDQSKALKDREQADADIQRLQREKAEALAQEDGRLADEIKKLREEIAKQNAPAAPTKPTAQQIEAMAGGGAGPGAAAAGKVTTNQYDALYKEAGAKYGVDWRWLKATAMQESGENPNAVGKPNANGTYDVGLMQHNSRYLASRGMTHESALDPRTSIFKGAELMANLKGRYGDNPAKVFERWNGTGPAARAHSAKVMANLGALGGGTPMPEGHEAAAATASKVAVSGSASIDVNLSVNGEKKGVIPVSTKLQQAQPSGS